jgi:hypothetical protein
VASVELVTPRMIPVVLSAEVTLTPASSATPKALFHTRSYVAGKKTGSQNGVDFAGTEIEKI